MSKINYISIFSGQKAMQHFFISKSCSCFLVLTFSWYGLVSTWHQGERKASCLIRVQNMSIRHCDHNVKMRSVCSVFAHKTEQKNVKFLLIYTAKSHDQFILYGCQCQHSANSVCAIIFLIICILAVFLLAFVSFQGPASFPSCRIESVEKKNPPNRRSP